MSTSKIISKSSQFSALADGNEFSEEEHFESTSKKQPPAGNATKRSGANEEAGEQRKQRIKARASNSAGTPSDARVAAATIDPKGADIAKAEVRNVRVNQVMSDIRRPASPTNLSYKQNKLVLASWVQAAVSQIDDSTTTFRFLLDSEATGHIINTDVLAGQKTKEKATVTTAGGEQTQQQSTAWLRTLKAKNGSQSTLLQPSHAAVVWRQCLYNIFSLRLLIDDGWSVSPKFEYLYHESTPNSRIPILLTNSGLYEVEVELHEERFNRFVCCMTQADHEAMGHVGSFEGCLICDQVKGGRLPKSKMRGDLLVNDEF